MSDKKKSGRPLKYGEKTVAIRVPERLVGMIYDFIKMHGDKGVKNDTFIT